MLHFVGLLNHTKTDIAHFDHTNNSHYWPDNGPFSRSNWIRVTTIVTLIDWLIIIDRPQRGSATAHTRTWHTNRKKMAQKTFKSDKAWKFRRYNINLSPHAHAPFAVTKSWAIYGTYMYLLAHSVLCTVRTIQPQYPEYKREGVWSIERIQLNYGMLTWNYK